MKKRHVLIFLLGLFVVQMQMSCKHNPNDILVPKEDTAQTPTPTPIPTPVAAPVNPKDSVCFDQEISPIIHSNCAIEGCHDHETRQSGVDLSSYQQMIATISGLTLLNKIQDTTESGMPPAPREKLSKAQINLIKKWEYEGMLEGIDCKAPCDTSNVTFALTIFPIIQNACLGCHNSTEPTIKNYTETKTIVDNGKLWCTINANGCTLMPKGGPKLSDCNILKIKKWLDAGAPNN